MTDATIVTHPVCLNGSAAQLLLGLLPPALWACVALFFLRALPAEPGRRRRALLFAAILTACWIVVGTEVLGFFHALKFGPVLAWWAASLAVAAGMLFRQGRSGRLGGAPRPAGLGRPWVAWPPALLGAALVALAGVVAALSPPTIRDTTIYHMPRVVYWIQQASLDHYPTGQLLQLAMPPLSEFACLHLVLLTESDALVGLVQWGAFSLAALAASLVALELGGRAPAQAVAALLAVANPMAWIEATNPKNDVIVGLWVLILAVLVARTLRDGRTGPMRWLLIGASAGLAAATKLTGIIYSLPLLAALGLWLLLRRPGGAGWFGGRLVVFPLAATVLAVTVAINAGFFARNLLTFGSLHGTGEIVYKDRPLTNETRTPAAIASVVIRNLALHAGTPSKSFNRRIEGMVRALHERAGLDADDPRTTAYERFRVKYAPWHDSIAGAPVHVILILLTLATAPLALMSGRRLDQRTQHPPGTAATEPAPAVRAAVMLGAALGGFLFFCALLKWQPWHARLHVGLISIFAPLAAVTLFRGRAFLTMPLCVVVILHMTPAIVHNERRELLRVLSTPRDDLRHPPGSELAEMTALLRAVRPRVVGLAVWPHEYTVQQHLVRHLDPPPSFCAPFAPASRWKGYSRLRPDAIVANVGAWARIRDQGSGEVFYEVFRHGEFRLLVPADMARRLHADGVLPDLEVPQQPEAALQVP